ncbi:MAG TPA: dUTP diphosphatase [Bacteroidales bacterium]|jgi:dUTP pyrophosphatase|nr:dUTP diphosphatase [Bacteroidales bacterium]MDI9532886.1 dUTP diphosphatase [Bacteroidota bacterium]MBK7732729.1 dUTP diphosphatase [Bacteroidales bacterium]MBP7035953.1 dUTP diphosphatase [Bacteroidales bacterium]MBP8709170.1 dUTP diphosphatase [Bacteroidales bacterium]
MKIRIVNKSPHPLPAYETEHSAGMDLRAFTGGPVTIRPMERKLIPTGLYIELPVGFEAQVRPRSGLAIRHGITVLNSPGTIDADYRGEIGVILINTSEIDYTINDGDRIAQMIISQYVKVKLKKAESIEMTVRGEGGFGHSGEK